MSKLDLLNERRAALGKPALKSWKGSQAKLDEAITALGHAIAPKKEEAAPGAEASATHRTFAWHRSQSRPGCASQISRRCMEVAD